MPEPLDNLAQFLLLAGSPLPGAQLQAIRFLRASTPLDLPQAKDIVDAVRPLMLAQVVVSPAFR